jgi:hypothetical protein
MIAIDCKEIKLKLLRECVAIEDIINRAVAEEIIEGINKIKNEITAIS